MKYQMLVMQKRTFTLAIRGGNDNIKRRQIWKHLVV